MRDDASSQTRSRATFAAMAMALAAVSMALVRGFSVDDAYIPARYAAHLWSGAGLRFNVGGAATDGVTPLPYAPMVALLARSSDVGEALTAARVAGAVAGLATAALLGAHVAAAGASRARVVALLPLAALPFAAWSVAGLETPWVTLLVAVAATADASPRGLARASIGAGLAAAFRPELAPLAIALSVGHAFRVDARLSLAAVAGALAPPTLVALTRLAAFGSPAPLSVSAKPSDLAHGAPYALAGLALSGAFALSFAPGQLVARRLSSRAFVCTLAALCHAGAVAVAGGDWMPLSRLLVPSWPLFIVAACDVAEVAAPWATAARALVAAAGMGWAALKVGPSAASVMTTRARLVEQGRPALTSAKVLATLDAGWPSAAFDGPIVDLAGLTDPAIARLPGGHTSKRITAQMLSQRGVDALLLLRARGCEGACVRADGGPFDREVEERVAADPWVRERFERAGEIAAGPLVYVLLTQRR